MDSELKALLNSIERFGRINKEDIPKLIKLVNELEASNNLAWYQLERLEKEMGAYR